MIEESRCFFLRSPSVQNTLNLVWCFHHVFKFLWLQTLEHWNTGNASNLWTSSWWSDVSLSKVQLWLILPFSQDRICFPPCIEMTLRQIVSSWSFYVLTPTSNWLLSCICFVQQLAMASGVDSGWCWHDVSKSFTSQSVRVCSICSAHYKHTVLADSNTHPPHQLHGIRKLP